MLPSNEGRGYVLRRIMRRAMRHAQLLGAAEPLMWKLVPALVREMGQAYPELVRGEALITETLKLEETRFRKTLARGLGLLAEATETLGSGDMLDGETAFKLYDTYGFPLDLTQDALRQRGISVDLDGFNDAMERQKAEARANWAGSGEAATETVWFSVREKAGATEFLGYDTEAGRRHRAGAGQGRRRGRDAPTEGEHGRHRRQPDAVLRRIRRPDGRHRHDLRRRLFDRGHRHAEEGRRPVRALRQGREGHGEDRRGGRAEGRPARRTRLRSNHSATHLVHEALREVLGTHVAQKGSLVAPERLRFDISHPKPISAEELEQVERMANEIVVQNSPVTTRLMSVDDAIAEGAMALFGEKYGDEVRVVSMGTGLHGAKANRPYSVELCGGTHVARHRRHRSRAHRLRQRGRGRRAPHRGADRRGGAENISTSRTGG